jgi:hypothetical protein
MAFRVIILMGALTVAAPAFAYCYYSNPYSAGSGHFAGFDWAYKHNVATCGGKSLSFIEGCKEYLRQKANCGA